jgi:hypothetical protein
MTAGGVASQRTFPKKYAQLMEFGSIFPDSPKYFQGNPFP